MEILSNRNQLTSYFHFVLLGKESYQGIPRLYQGYTKTIPGLVSEPTFNDPFSLLKCIQSSTLYF